MTLNPGTRLGPYQVTAQIGHGGMGEVYRATDSTLGREVAIKVLPEAFALDADRLARFEREARTLASLNHPNIAIVFGFERVNHETGPEHAGRALVMELVDGPTLADLIAQGPMPIDEALPIAKQIAEALEAAHEHGIIHRDLKPANVKLRADGRVKVLDFGLAKATEPAGAMSSMASMSPTITTPAMTQAGILLGTAAYMSPEQARGKPVDKRADVWAFGCVLFEMLSGRRTVGDEETVSDTLASVLKGEPAWNALPADTPPRIRTLIERCLRKDVRRRLPDIAEARIQIEEAAADPLTPAPPPTATRHRGFVWPAVSLLSVLTALGLAAWMAFTPAREDATVIRFQIHAPAGATPLESDGRLITVGPGISPDGLAVAFLANTGGRTRLWLQPLDGELRPLDGTEDAGRAAWSPDSRQIAFITRGLLKRVSVEGGPPTEICKLEARDITWAPGAVILVGGGGHPLMRVSPETCNPQPATTLASGELTHDYPHFLPDGRRFLYLSRRGAESADWQQYVGRLDSREPPVLVPGIHSGARYTAGHLLFVRDGALMAQPFDVQRLRTTGDAFQLGDGFNAPSPPFSVSDTGSLAYTPLPTTRTTQLVWFDRNGKQIGLLGEPGDYRRFDLSGDARFVAFDRDVADRGLDVFVMDIERGPTSRVVSSAAADFAAVWSPNSTAIAFGSSREPTGNAGPGNPSAGNLYQRAVGIVQPDVPLTKGGAGKTPSDWSINDYVAYTSTDDIWALKVPVSADPAPVRVTDSTFRERDGRFSLDGQWIAYESNETGMPTDVYVQSFPDRSAKQAVSINGGSKPRWSRDGRQLFYVTPDSMLMSVSIVRDGNGVRISPPMRVFPLPGDGNADYDVAGDGRFLVNLPTANQTAPPLTVIHNWGASLKKK